jgi:hypothetical protein
MKVITLCNRKYFPFGEFFLATRKNVKADFVLYGADLTTDQKAKLKDYSIAFENVPAKEFETKMQFLKFKILREHPGETRTLVDFDTLFLKDWSEVFNTPFDLGITIRNDFIKKGTTPRAYANGGVIFCGKESSADSLCQLALDVMASGKDKRLPEYDSIFRTLEENRPKHKTWKRDNLRWWCDQVFLSALVQRYFKTVGGRKTVKYEAFYDLPPWKVGMFSCTYYNLLDPKPHAISRSRAYILHLKTQGRDRMRAIRKALKARG